MLRPSLGSQPVDVGQGPRPGVQGLLFRPSAKVSTTD